MQRSASDSVGLIFTRSHRSTLLITTPTTTPSLVKTSLQGTTLLFLININDFLNCLSSWGGKELHCYIAPPGIRTIIITL